MGNPFKMFPGATYDKANPASEVNSGAVPGYVPIYARDGNRNVITLGMSLDEMFKAAEEAGEDPNILNYYTFDIEKDRVTGKRTVTVYCNRTVISGPQPY